MMLRILFNSYPLLPVSQDSAGGAEQMLWTLERELCRRGHRTAVAAPLGSKVSGELIPTGIPSDEADRLEQRGAEHRAVALGAIRQARERGTPFDLIHDESGMFWRNSAAQIVEPMLATLHLPLPFYGMEAFENPAPKLSFNFVSASQRLAFCSRLPALAGAQVVANGIAVEDFPFRRIKGDYLLWLGRICEEKGAHVAIRVAGSAGLPLILAGRVYPFGSHRQYLRERIAPSLGDNVRLFDSPDFETKCRLLSGARALLLPVRDEETSSLVAMEAMACGTPVIAFRRGALGEIVAEGETGFVVENEAEMLQAVRRAGGIAAADCRRRAEEQFTAQRMATQYEHVYAQMLNRKHTTAA
ncbi:MAG: glycosyltransferase family 4 protein [Acidobacteria bacterium]|nr:glycosyltransferase family 4 protein [Acidobacteriota bacterium]